MARESANHAFRQIRILFTQGAVGGLTDAQLVDRFLDRDASGREDAFAALVQRHGPMVWRVCRRMLGGSADADDAFQAVFLVLARKARTLRRADTLKPWLYGVAVRTAREARRRAARRRAREGGPMDESKIVSATMDGHADLLPLLDEEIDQPKEFQGTRKLPWMQAFLGEGVHGPIPQMFGIRAIPAFVLLGPDGKIVARGMRGEEIKNAVSKALATP